MNRKKIKQFLKTKDHQLYVFFGFLLLVIVIKLFSIQIIQATYYDQVLSSQQIQQTTLTAKRGYIYVTDNANQDIQLTENITLYTVFVDPEFVTQKDRFISKLTPLVYYHFCKQYGLQEPDHLQCIKNIENFTNTKILPEKPKIFYYASGLVSKNYYEFDFSGYNAQFTEALSGFTQIKALNLIKKQLNKIIIRGNKKFNYLGFFENPDFINMLRKKHYAFIEIRNDHYVYLDYEKAKYNIKRVRKDLLELYQIFEYKDAIAELDHALTQQRYRYVRIITNANPVIAKKIDELQTLYYHDRDSNGIPLFHGIGLEAHTKRYYPFGTFLANVLGYINNNGVALHGIEQYFDELLAGKNGKIQGRSSSWVGTVGAGDFNIKEAQNGANIYLTINLGIQKGIEKLAKEFHKYLNADSISVLIYDPFSGHIISSVNYPTFDPNNFQEAFRLQPLSPKYRKIVDNETYADIPVYIYTGTQLKLANLSERIKSIIPKYIPQNVYGPSVFVDKNISYPYDPGSIFKTFTYTIGLDTKEINMYEYYDDPDNFVKIDQYTITNANKICQGTHNFLFALQHSCNVGIVRIVQKLSKYVFYNYLQKFGFGQLTHIELANEDAGYVPSISTVSTARFLNNSFGLGILVTPLQIATAYGAIVNHGELLKPTIIKKICNPDTKKCQYNKTKIIRQVFSPAVTDQVLQSLIKVVEAKENAENVAISGYKLGGKSGTAALVYKCLNCERAKYMEGDGWTNASYVGILTPDNPKYVVVIQVRRPRISQWGTETAGKMFKEIAKFLIKYEMIEK